MCATKDQCSLRITTLQYEQRQALATKLLDYLVFGSISVNTITSEGGQKEIRRLQKIENR